MKSSKVVHNPYKKVKKTEQASSKRSHRPWETNSNPSASSTIAPSSHDNEIQMTINNHINDAESPSLQIRSSLSMEEDNFDGGIDWSVALKTLEDQSAFDVPVRPLTSNPVSGDVGVASQTSKPAAVQAKANSSLPSRINVDANALSDLRPDSWTGSSKVPLSNSMNHRAAPAANGHNNAEDPDQHGLPSAIRFEQKDVMPIRDAYQKELVKNADISSPLLNGWTLYGHQKRAILKALAMRRCILALDMGLGKTIIGCVWAKSFVHTLQTHVIVLCPVSLQEEWKRTMENAVGLVVHELIGMSKKKTEDAMDDNPQPSVSIHSWSKIPESMDDCAGDFVVVADEAHSIQSMQAARTKETLKLVSNRRCVGVLLLSGTPMKNGKPSNLFPLLKAVNHPLGRNQKAYETHFCAGREVNFGRGRVWQATGSSNLEQLRKLAKSHMLHLTKEACLKDLPPLTRVFLKVPVSSRRRLQHTHALQELAKIYDSHTSGADERILGAVQKVRMIGSLAKVEAAVEQAKKILEEEAAVVLFTSFQEVAKQVHQQLAEAGWNGELLTGETPAKKRQGMVDNFQKGLSPVFCCTFGAGGVGLTLTAAHSVILVDRPWTPGDAHQAEDRVRRIGQTKPVRSVWLRAFDVDEQIDGMIEQKQQTASAVLEEGSSESSARQDAPRLSIFQMLKSILPASQDGLTQTCILQYSQS